MKIKQIIFVGLLALGVLLHGTLGVAQGFNSPDLIVEEITLDPPVVKAGDPLTIRAKIVNDGRVRVEDRIDVQIKVDNVRIANLRVRLNIRGEGSVEVSWEAVEGDHTVTVEVDAPRNQILESNERNNSLEKTFTVAPDSNLISLSRSALEAQATAWMLASEALAVKTESTNLLLLLDLVKQGFDDFSSAIGVATATLDPLGALWPSAFAENNIYSPLTTDYRAVLLTADAIRGGLDSIDLDAVIASMVDMESAFRALAVLDSAQLPLGRLNDAANTLALANQAVLDAQQAFADGDASAQVADLVSEVRELSAIFSEISTAFFNVADTQTISFLDAQGEALRDLTDVSTLNISAPVAGVRFELINSRGEVVADLSTSESVLAWNLTNTQGNPVSSGTYFFRITVAGTADVGSILVP
jgi:hypothetical protein